MFFNPDIKTVRATHERCSYFSQIAFKQLYFLKIPLTPTTPHLNHSKRNLSRLRARSPLNPGKGWLTYSTTRQNDPTLTIKYPKNLRVQLLTSYILSGIFLIGCLRNPFTLWTPASPLMQRVLFLCLLLLVNIFTQNNKNFRVTKVYRGIFQKYSIFFLSIRRILFQLCIQFHISWTHFSGHFSPQKTHAKIL